MCTTYVCRKSLHYAVDLYRIYTCYLYEWQFHNDKEYQKRVLKEN